MLKLLACFRCLDRHHRLNAVRIAQMGAVD
jgi:hypothetical protein